MSSLCNGDIYRPLRIEIFDWDKNGKHQSMGVVSSCACIAIAPAFACMSMMMMDVPWLIGWLLSIVSIVSE